MSSEQWQAINAMADELDNANKQVAELKQQLAEQQARHATPEQREEAATEAQGRAILAAVKRDKSRT